MYFVFLICNAIEYVILDLLTNTHIHMHLCRLPNVNFVFEIQQKIM